MSDSLFSEVHQDCAREAQIEYDYHIRHMGIIDGLWAAYRAILGMSRGTSNQERAIALDDAEVVIVELINQNLNPVRYAEPMKDKEGDASKSRGRTGGETPPTGAN